MSVGSSANAAPRRVFLENVVGHVFRGFDSVVGDLQSLRLRVAAGVFAAAEVGASHEGKRLFILAKADRDDDRQPPRSDPGGRADLSEADLPILHRGGGSGLARGAGLGPAPLSYEPEDFPFPTARNPTVAGAAALSANCARAAPAKWIYFCVVDIWLCPSAAISCAAWAPSSAIHDATECLSEYGTIPSGRSAAGRTFSRQMVA
jgi:hypothetical protein